MIFSMLPDADVVAFRFGIPYDHMLGHCGLSHSLVFAATPALFAAFWPASRCMLPRIFLFFFFASASHGVLDAMITSSKMTGFFIPFDAERYFCAWRPIQVSPLSIKGFFNERGWVIF